MSGLGVCPDKLGKLRIQGSDTAVEFAPLGTHVGDQLVDAGAQPLGSLRDQGIDLAFEHASSLREGDPALQQDRAQLVEQCLPDPNHPRAGPVQGL